MTDFFPDESILNIEAKDEYLSWGMYFDGVVNVHENRIDDVLIFAKGSHFR